MKKKLMSLIFGAFMMVFSLFSLSACALVSTDINKVNKQTVMTVNGTKLSKSDIYSSFYTYYQNNSNYFSYYDSKTIEESFYTWAIIREVIDQKAQEALVNVAPDETNADGFIYYTKEDEETVWKNVQEYFYTQIGNQEKAIYALEGYEEEKYPVWIRAEEEETSDTIFEAYETAKPEAVDPDRANPDNLAYKLSDSDVKAKFDALKTYLFEYVVEEADEDAGKEEVRADIDETGYEVGARNQAYANYVWTLARSAVANGKKVGDAKKLFEDELIRVYNAYYDSQITTIFQKCYLEEKLVASDLMNDDAIVKAYLDQYFTDLQVYQSEAGYINTMTASDGATLVLYNYNGQNYFFSVQHILLGYDENMKTELSEMEGYASSSSVDYDEIIHNAFLQERKEFTEARQNAILSTVKETYNLEGVVIEGDYYFYDSNLKDDESKNFGYIKVLPHEIEEDGKIKTIYFVDADNNNVYNEDIDTVTYTEDQVVFMANKDDVLKTFENAKKVWIQDGVNDGIIVSYFKSDDDGEKTAKRDTYKNMAYLFDVADQMKASGKTVDELKEKTASLLFVELQWIFSSDSLKNEFANKVGYIMSNYEDENGSWVTDFAVGARKILKEIEEGRLDISALTETNIINSNYGYHIIKVENVYKSGSSLVDMTGINLNNMTESDVDELVERLKSTYTSTSSNQTVYDYFYDKLYTGYAGSSAEGSTGTYFLDLEYEWLVELYDENKITYQNKIGYDELMDYLQ